MVLCTLCKIHVVEYVAEIHINVMRFIIAFAILNVLFELLYILLFPSPGI